MEPSLPFEPGDVLVPLPNKMNGFYGTDNACIYVFSKADFFGQPSYCAIKIFSIQRHHSHEIVLSCLTDKEERLQLYSQLFDFLKSGQIYTPKQNPELSMMDLNYMARHHTHFKRSFMKISSVKEMDDYFQSCLDAKEIPEYIRQGFSPISSLRNAQSSYDIFRKEVLISSIALKYGLFEPSFIATPFE